MKDLIPIDEITKRIFFLRGYKVMLASDLAMLYGVQTKVLNQAVRRNHDRFPMDFMFELTWDEVGVIQSRSQIVTLIKGKNIKHLPIVFTEQGVAMLSSVLRSKNAVRVNIEIMRAFVKMREVVSHHKELFEKMTELEKVVSKHDSHIHTLFEAIRELMKPPIKSKRQIGF